MLGMKRRVVAFELKATDDVEARTFEGYGSVFDEVDSYGDAVASGAFKRSLREWRSKGKLPKLLLQHGGPMFGGSAEDMTPIGKWTEMREDDTGLFVRGRLFDTDSDRAKDTYAAVKEGELDGLSIGYLPRKSKLDEETQIRTLTDIDLWEVSLVTFPANAAALVSSVKSAEDLPTEREFERFLRDAGFSRAQAKRIVSHGYRDARRDAMPSEVECEDLVTLLGKGAAIWTGAKA